MKKLFVIIAILFSNLMAANTYSEGFKLYKQAKKELRKGHIEKANAFFLLAKEKFDISIKKHSSQALLKVAELYCNGWGVDENPTKAKQYLQKAKELGVSFISSKCLKNLK